MLFHYDLCLCTSQSNESTRILLLENLIANKFGHAGTIACILVHIPCHSTCGTLKNPHCSLAMSAENRSKFAALHQSWWRLHMSEKFSSGMKNYKQTNKTCTHNRDVASFLTAGNNNRHRETAVLIIPKHKKV